MVLVAVKQIEQTVQLNDVENVSILGLDQGCILLFSATTKSLSRNPSVPRTVIGGVQLSDGDQKIYYRHSTSVKITHASINATRTWCCFVIRTESYDFDAFVVAIDSTNQSSLFSLNFSRPSSIRAYLAPHDIILLLYRDAITVFRLPNKSSAMDKSVSVDKDAQISDCVYYQWDTLYQRLHVIQKRSLPLTKTIPASGYDALIYTAYVINPKGQFDSTMKIDVDIKIPSSSSSHSRFEILSDESSLFLCWQSIIKETEKVEYAVISLGHGRSLYISKSLNKKNLGKLQSRKVHFGLLDGDYIFALLRGEFIHLLNFNVHLNFLNHLFFPNDDDSLSYETKYTTQRGLLTKTATLLYERKNLSAYTIEINPNELIKTISPITIESTIAYALVASKDNQIFEQILKKILFHMYDDLNTKAYLKEILTALTFIRLSKRIHHNKYILVFPATTVNARHMNDTDVSIRSYAHHREHGPEHGGIPHIDKEYFDKLRSLFDLSRKYRHKVSYYHPIMASMDENEFHNELGHEFNPARRVSTGSSPPPQSPPRRASTGIFSFGKQRDKLAQMVDSSRADDQRYYILLEPKNKYLFDSVLYELHQLHPNWEQGRIKELAVEYVHATQVQCDYLIELFTRLARFSPTQGIIDDEPEPASEKYKTLLVVIEKLYLAMVELGFSPTEKLQRTLIEVSFRVMPFDRFVAAVDQNILTLTEEFVSRIIIELDDDPKSYAMKEQLILMLPNINSDLHSRLFALIKTDRAKRMTAQLLVARSFSTDNRTRGRTTSYTAATSHEIQVDEMMNANSNQHGTNTHSRLVEQAAVTFFRDCNQRGILDDDEMGFVKVGLFSLASSAP